MSAGQRLIVAALLLATGVAVCGPAIAGPATRSGPRDVCHEHFGDDYDPYGRWVGTVVTTLCNDGNADSKLAVYLLSVPPIEGGHVEPDETLLDRALEGAGKNDAALLYVAATRGCRDDSLAVAKRLTDADPGNGLAWLTRASIAVKCGEDEHANEAVSSLSAAARSRRFHDYGFDIMKRTTARLVRVPVPPEVIETRHEGTPDLIRFEVVREVLVPSMAFTLMDILGLVERGCLKGTPVDSDEVRAACDSVKRGLSTFGDSAALLEFDPERQRAAMANAEALYRDTREADVAKAAMRAMAHSHSENEFYRRTRALIGEPKAAAKAH